MSKLIRLGAPLIVQPVRSYQPPRYPRAGEPLDLSFDDASTWPFSATLAAALVATSLGSCGRGDTPDPVGVAEATPVARVERPVARKTEPRRKPANNPFHPERVRLESGGKGGPMTLPREIALAAIAKGFAASGLRLVANVPFKTHGVVAELDGYDRHKRVGFEWVARIDEPPERRLDEKERRILARPSRHHIAIIDSYDGRFVASNRGAAERLTRAVQAYVDYLRSIGAL